MDDDLLDELNAPDGRRTTRHELLVAALLPKGAGRRLV